MTTDENKIDGRKTRDVRPKRGVNKPNRVCLSMSVPIYDLMVARSEKFGMAYSAFVQTLLMEMSEDETREIIERHAEKNKVEEKVKVATVKAVKEALGGITKEEIELILKARNA